MPDPTTLFMKNEGVCPHGSCFHKISLTGYELSIIGTGSDALQPIGLTNTRLVVWSLRKLLKGGVPVLRKLWSHLTSVPEGLDWFDRLYVRSHYVIAGILALTCPLLLVAASTGTMSMRQRLFLIGSAALVIVVAYTLHRFVYWLQIGKLKLLSFIR